MSNVQSQQRRREKQGALRNGVPCHHDLGKASSAHFEDLAVHRRALRDVHPELQHNLEAGHPILKIDWLHDE